MPVPLGEPNTTLYVMEEDTYKYLRHLASTLNSGYDKDRDLGHKLHLKLDQLHKFPGSELYST